MAIKLVLTAEQIGNKIFKGVPRGYDPYEVDKFLDQIITDYERVESNYLVTQGELEGLKKRINQLEKEKADMEIELGKLKAKYSKIKPTDNVTNDNINLIKRINTLETFLWQNGFNPHNIK